MPRIEKWASGWNSPELPGQVFASREKLTQAMGDEASPNAGQQVDAGLILRKLKSLPLYSRPDVQEFAAELERRLPVDQGNIGHLGQYLVGIANEFMPPTLSELVARQLS
jgi:hypothetical protein